MEKRIFAAVLISIGLLWLWAELAPRLFPELVKKPAPKPAVTATTATTTNTATTAPATTTTSDVGRAASPSGRVENPSHIHRASFTSSRAISSVALSDAVTTKTRSLYPGATMRTV